MNVSKEIRRGILDCLASTNKVSEYKLSAKQLKSEKHFIPYISIHFLSSCIVGCHVSYIFYTYTVFFYFFPDVDIADNYIEIASLLILNTVLYKMLVLIINRSKKFYSKTSNFS